MRRRGQEEMFGFILIVIIVMVLLLIFLAYFLNQPKESLESYQAESFIQSFLPYTTDCRDNLEFSSVQKLIFRCYAAERCVDGRSTCEVLESTLRGIVEESWQVENRPIAGYDLQILSNGGEMVILKQGNETNTHRTSFQDFSRGGNSFEILFTIYE